MSELQVLDTNGDFGWRLSVHERAYQVLVDGAQRTVYGSALAHLGTDFNIPAADVPDLYTAVRAGVSKFIVSVKDAGQALVPDTQLINAEICGMVIRLYPRLTPHAALIRLRPVCETLERASVHGLGLVALYVPELSPTQFYLLQVVRECPDEMDVSELRDALAARYRKLLNDPVVTAELRSEFEARLADLASGYDIHADLSLLRRAGLVDSDEARGTVSKTEKLTAIRL